MTEQVDASSLPASAFPPNADPAAYTEQMTGATAPEPQIATRDEITAHQPPEGVPAKFFDAKTGKVDYTAWGKAHSELERQFHGARAEKKADPEAPAQTPQEALTIEKPADTAEPVANPLTDAIDAFSTRYLETQGQPTEDDISALEKAGLPRNVIDGYLEGLRVREAVMLSDAHKAAGGKDVFDAAIQWAASALTADEIAFYDAQVTDTKSSRQAVEWLMSKYNAANPSEGRFIEAEPANAGGDVFRSQAELTQAMGSPDYQRDPAFRQKVAEKLQRSLASGSISSNSKHFGTRR